MAETLVNVRTFAGMICADGHVDPTGKSTCNVIINVPQATPKNRKRKCGKQLGRPVVTIRVMCARGEIKGAIRPGNEWMINLSEASKYQIEIRGRGKPRT